MNEELLATNLDRAETIPDRIRGALSKMNKPTPTRQAADIIMGVIFGSLFIAALLWLVYFFGFAFLIEGM